MTHLAFAGRPDFAMSIPFVKREGDEIVDCWTPEEELAILLTVRDLFQAPYIKWIAHNSQFDLAVLSYLYGITVPELYLDTMIGMHCCYSELPKDLDTLVSIFTKQPYYGGWKSQGDLQFRRYNAMDACVTREIADVLEGEIKRLGVWAFYRERMASLIPVLLDMQLRGVRCDVEARDRVAAELRVQYEAACVRVNECAEQNINPHSPKEVGEYFYGWHGLAKRKQRKTGSMTVDDEALASLRRAHPEHAPTIDAILEARHTRKILSTYVDAPLSEGRMHTSYNIGGRLTDAGGFVSAPETGRLSSSKSIVIGSGTNLQNVPHGICRSLFVPDEGKVLAEPDLSQAEARVVAYLAGEEKLIRAFAAGEDIHLRMAAWLFSVPPADVTKEQRTFAKRHVHAFNYGEGPRRLAQQAGISEAEAKRIRDKYFSTFPAIQRWQMRVEAQLYKTRLFETAFGRKRRFFGRRGADLVREAIAFVPQSTVGDLLNVALVRTAALLKEHELDAQLLLQEHDAFALQCRPDDLSVVREILAEAFDITLVIEGRELLIPHEVKVGPNWEELEVVT